MSAWEYLLQSFQKAKLIEKFFNLGGKVKPCKTPLTDIIERKNK